MGHRGQKDHIKCMHGSYGPYGSYAIYLSSATPPPIRKTLNFLNSFCRVVSQKGERSIIRASVLPAIPGIVFTYCAAVNRS
jgi:hypothetical protein